MIDSFLRMNEPQLMFLTGLIGMALASITIVAGIAAVQWRKLRLRELELGFKDDMLDRGLTAAEIDMLWSGSRPGWLTQVGQLIAKFWRALVRAVIAFFTACRRFVLAVMRAATRRKLRLTRQELVFKRDMIDRGLSVSDVERLMVARRPGLISTLFSALAALTMTVINGCRILWAWGVGQCRQFNESLHRAGEWQ